MLPSVVAEVLAVANTIDPLAQLLSGGATPDEVRRQLEAEDYTTGRAMASNPSSAGFLGLMNSGSRDFQEAMGKRDSRLDKAMKMELFKKKVAKRAQEQGVDISSDPNAFGRMVFSQAMEDGMPEIAFEAMNFARKAGLEERKTKVAEDNAKSMTDYREAQGTWLEERARLYDELNKIKRLQAENKANNKKPAPAKYPTSKMEKDMLNYIGNDSVLKDMGFDDTTAGNMAKDAAGDLAKALRDDPDTSLEDHIDTVLEKIRNRTYHQKNKYWFDKRAYFRTPEDVKSAVSAGTLPKEDAIRILQNGFGMK